MVQNIVEADSHQSELLSWGQELWSAKCNTQGNYFLQRYGEKPLQKPQCAELGPWSCCEGQRVGRISEG